MRHFKTFVVALMLLTLSFVSCEKNPPIEDADAAVLAEYESLIRSYLPYKLGDQIVLTSEDTTLIFTVILDSIKTAVDKKSYEKPVYDCSHWVTFSSDNRRIELLFWRTNAYITVDEGEFANSQIETYFEESNRLYLRARIINPDYEPESLTPADRLMKYFKDEFPDTFLLGYTDHGIVFERHQGITEIRSYDCYWNDEVKELEEWSVIWTVTRK